MRPLHRLAVLAALSIACGTSQAEIDYTVRPVGDLSHIQVTMRFDAGPGAVEVQSPNWSPGDYTLHPHGRDIQELRWLAPDGSAVLFEHPLENDWTGTLSAAGATTIEYTAPARFEAGALHFSGPTAYLYVVGRKEEACRLTLDLPPEWKVAVGLESVEGSSTEYRAPGYDVLADNPVTAGDFLDLHYISHGKPVTIAVRGENRTSVDPEKLVKLCQTISDCEGDFFGGVPYEKYVWHVGLSAMEDGGGGLEHLSSTQVVLAQGLGPEAARACAHEFFHLWNVKRIRSRALGPFDYTQLPKTGALWWLEGVTDYYASLLLHRCRYVGDDVFLKDLADNVSRVRSNPARLEVSPYESSLRVGEANDGRGNGGGWGISFYSHGWLAGLCLDLDLRFRTKGKRSLDDVERALWEICKDGRPGFEEDEIEKQYVRMGGSGKCFESIVMKPGELPVEELLDRVGLRLEQSAETFVDRGFDFTWTFGAPTICVDDVRPFAAAAGLASDDMVLEINGKSVAATDTRNPLQMATAALGELKAGDPIQLKLRHEGVERVCVITCVEASTAIVKIVDAASGDADKLSLRNGWYFAGGK